MGVLRGKHAPSQMVKATSREERQTIRGQKEHSEGTMMERYEIVFWETQ
jgi:hypothetical protein